MANVVLGVFLGVSFVGWFVGIAVWLQRTLPKIEPQASSITVVRLSEPDEDDVTARVVAALSDLAVSKGLPPYPVSREWMAVSIATMHAVLGPELSALLADGELS